MNRFKNYVSVTGSKEELETFAKELEKAGYHTDKSCFTRKYKKGITHIICYEDGEYGYYKHDGYAQLFSLPAQKK